MSKMYFMGDSYGGSVVVDNEPNPQSTNPLQNKIICEELSELDSKIPTTYFVSKTSSGTQMWIDFMTDLRAQVIQKYGTNTTQLSGVFEQSGVNNWKFIGVYSGYILYVLCFLDSAIRYMCQFGDGTTKIWDIPVGTTIL